MFRAATLSTRSFIEEAVKCLLRELINAGHSIRMYLTVSEIYESAIVVVIAAVVVAVVVIFLRCTISFQGLQCSSGLP